VVSYRDYLNPHTLWLTTQNAYARVGNTYNLLTLPGGVASLAGTGFPYYPVIANGKVYFSNGSAT